MQIWLEMVSGRRERRNIGSEHLRAVSLQRGVKTQSRCFGDMGSRQGYFFKMRDMAVCLYNGSHLQGGVDPTCWRMRVPGVTTLRMAHRDSTAGGRSWTSVRGSGIQCHQPAWGCFPPATGCCAGAGVRVWDLSQKG